LETGQRLPSAAVPARYGQPMPFGALVLDMCVMPSLAPVIKLWGQRGLSTMAARTAYARGRPHEKCHGDCYQILVNCYVKVMLAASVGDDPLSTCPSASSTSTPPVGAAPWLPPAAYALIEKSCSARPNGWPQPQFLLSIEYFLRLLRLLLLRSMPAFFLFAQ
jgi:hypothetical protein